LLILHELTRLQRVPTPPKHIEWFNLASTILTVCGSETDTVETVSLKAMRCQTFLMDK